MLQIIQVVSSNLNRVAYKNRVVYIEFKGRASGPTHYKYMDVSRDVFDAFLKAESLGKYFIANIRDKYETIKLTPDEAAKLGFNKENLNGV